MCNEREWLLLKAQTAINLHSARALRLESERANAPATPDELVALRVDVERCFDAAQAAWDEYRKHVHEHGCTSDSKGFGGDDHIEALPFDTGFRSSVESTLGSLRCRLRSLMQVLTRRKN